LPLIKSEKLAISQEEDVDAQAEAAKIRLRARGPMRDSFRNMLKETAGAFVIRRGTGAGDKAGGA
jgi:hypothetical protein